MGTGFSMLGGYTTESKTPTASSKSELKANYLPITLGLKLQAGNGNFLPYLYIAPCVFIPLGVHSEGIIKYEGQEDRKSETTYKFAAGFGVSSGIGLQLKLSDVLGMKIECSPTFAFARMKEMTTEDYQGNKSTLVYKKDATDLPESTPEKMYLHGAPMYPFSSIAAKFGLLLDF